MSLFIKDEEVILQSRDLPELNGDAVVLEVITNSERMVRIQACNPHLNVTFEGPNNNKGDGLVYILNIFSPNANPKIRGDNGWSSVALRKKYKPGEEYDTLMDILKSGDVIEA